MASGFNSAANDAYMMDCLSGKDSERAWSETLYFLWSAFEVLLKLKCYSITMSTSLIPLIPASGPTTKTLPLASLFPSLDSRPSFAKSLSMSAMEWVILSLAQLIGRIEGLGLLPVGQIQVQSLFPFGLHQAHRASGFRERLTFCEYLLCRTE